MASGPFSNNNVEKVEDGKGAKGNGGKNGFYSTACTVVNIPFAKYPPNPVSIAHNPETENQGGDIGRKFSSCDSADLHGHSSQRGLFPLSPDGKKRTTEFDSTGESVLFLDMLDVCV